jgi:hypothetical protein
VLAVALVMSVRKLLLASARLRNQLASEVLPMLCCLFSVTSHVKFIPKIKVHSERAHADIHRDSLATTARTGTRSKDRRKKSMGDSEEGPKRIPEGRKSLV